MRLFSAAGKKITNPFMFALFQTSAANFQRLHPQFRLPAVILPQQTVPYPIELEQSSPSSSTATTFPPPSSWPPPSDPESLPQTDASATHPERRTRGHGDRHVLEVGHPADLAVQEQVRGTAPHPVRLAHRPLQHSQAADVAGVLVAGRY